MGTNRIDLLRSYLTALASDMAAQGKFAAPGNNKVEAYARAALNGTGAMAAQLAADLKTVGGIAVAMGQPIAEGLMANAAAGAARAVAGKAGAFLGELFSGRAHAKEEQRDTGKRLMDAAAKMGKRR